VGATPLAITNCLNFANPQRPEIMAQIVEALRGMGDACRALDYPIVSGNVSLYNESKATGGGSAILPTPAIGGVGLMQDHAVMATIAFKNDGDGVWLLGGSGTHLGQSIWLREVHAREEGAPPPVDLAAERAHAETVRGWINAGQVTAVHDVSDGGLLVALAEMAMASGKGCTLDVALDAAQAFGEDQGRYVVTAPAGTELAGAVRIGTVGGSAVVGVDVAALKAANEAFFHDWMEG
jgi:phosphoribosylformylglycinamidine synthase